MNLDVVLDIKVTFPRPFGLRVKLHVPIFGGLNFFLKLRAVVRFKRQVQQRMLNEALSACTENFVHQRFARYFSIVFHNLRDATRFVFVAHYNLGHEMKEREIGRAYGISRMREMLTRFM
jgi:hypothetical protein